MNEEWCRHLYKQLPVRPSENLLISCQFFVRRLKEDVNRREGERPTDAADRSVP
jgi:hypothetical protein